MKMKFRWLLFRYTKGSVETTLELVAGFVNSKDALEYAEEFIDGDFTGFSIKENL